MNQLEDIKRIKRGALLSFIFAFVLLMLALFGGIHYAHKESVKVIENAFEKQISLSMQHTLEHYNEKYTALLENVISEKSFINAVKNFDKSELKAFLAPRLLRWQKEDKFIESLFIFEKDRPVFVVLPDIKAEILRKQPCRPMIKKIHQTHKAIYGFDFCKTCHCYRVVLPIFDNDEYIGAVELGYNPMVMLQQLKNLTGYESALLIPDNTNKEHWIIKGYSSEFNEILKKLNGHKESYIDTHQIIKHNGKLYNLHPFVIRDYLGKSQAEIVLFHDMSSSKIEILPISILFIIFSLIMMLVFLKQRNKIINNLEKLHSLYLRDIEKSEAKLIDFYENSPDMYASVDAKTSQILYCNKSFYKKLGFDSKDELLGKKIFEIYHNDSKSYVKQKLFPEFLKAGEIHEHELTLCRKDGSRLYASLDVTAIDDKYGNHIASHSILHDMSDIHEARKNLKFNVSYLQVIFDTEPNIMLTTYGEKIDRVNNALLEFTGYESVNSFKSDYDCICDMFLKRDGYLQRDMGELNWLEYIYAHPQKSHKVLIIKNNQEYIFYISANRLLFDEQNRSIIIMTDITKEMLSEKKLKASEERYRQFFEENSAVMILIDPESGKIIDINEAAKLFYGYTHNELISMNIRQINQLSDKEIDEKMQEAKLKRTTHFEFIHKLSSGELRNVDVYSGPVKDGENIFLLSIVHDVTSRNKAVLELKEREAYIQSIFKVTPVGIGVVKERIIKNVNTYFHTMTGYSEDELIGKSARVLYPSDEEYEYVGKKKYDEIKEHGTGSVQTRFKCKDGSIINVILSSTPIDENDLSKGVTFTALDITEIKKVQRENFESKERYRSIVEDINEWIWEVDVNGEFTYTSPRVESILGYAADEIMGKSLFEFIVDRELEDTREKFKTIIDSNKPFANMLSTQLTKDAKEVVIETNGRPVTDENGKVISYRGTNLDITQKNKLEHELKEKDEMMIAQSRQAAMGDMIAMIAHQWRQPITVIAMSVNNLKADIELGEEITNDEIEKMSNNILNQTQHLSKTIDDFRNFFKPNKERTETSIAVVISKAMTIIGKSLQNNNIEVKINIDSDVKLLTYENELLQVFLNIINNAKDALKDLKSQDAKLSIDTVKDLNIIKISFYDNGGGIKEDIMQKLGEPYVSSKSKNGTGLGIYMSKIIVQKHLGGELSWYNRDDGACFTLRLPIDFKEETKNEGQSNGY